MASDRQRQRRRRPRASEGQAGLPADEVQDAGLGEIENDAVDPVDVGGHTAYETEALLAEAGAEAPAVGGRHREDTEEHEVERRTGPRKGIFGRSADFLRASWNELKRVQWPDRRQVGQGTAVTVGFVIVAGAYLGALDAIWNPIIQAIL
jgi:preprotein translocase SecE subunit